MVAVDAAIIEVLSRNSALMSALRPRAGRISVCAIRRRQRRQVGGLRRSLSAGRALRGPVGVNPSYGTYSKSHASTAWPSPRNRNLIVHGTARSFSSRRVEGVEGWIKPGKGRTMYVRAMTAIPPYNDAPIVAPDEDRFGIDPFAKSLASSIRKMSAPEGTVLALNGPWGSGKSSAVNLIHHHLKEAVDRGELIILNFACWWFRGEEALALAFFRELYAGLGPSLGDRFKQALPKIGARLLKAGGALGAGIDLAGGGGAGSVAAGAMNWLSGLIKEDNTIEKLHADLVNALREQKKRFLIIIDDIDRLAPDEALLVFRLVKSVGRLPNVLYLLAFDRKLAEAVVAKQYPTEGPHYLEKIIQAGFDIPLPRQTELGQQLLEQIGALCGAPAESDLVRFMNTFYDVVLPEVRTPRDLVRLMNAFSVTWPAVGSEVDEADFVALETLRVFRPEVYGALRGGKELLCGADGMSAYRSVSERTMQYDRLLSAVSDDKKGATKNALMRIFPRTQAIWSNVHYNDAERWAAERRACSERHFDAYFRFALGDEALQRSAIDDVIAHAADREHVQVAFRRALATARSGGRTTASLLLDELKFHADKVPAESVEPLLCALFEIADELQVEGDKEKAFSIGDNQLRLHWLLRRLTLERFDLARRSATFVAACRNAQLGWLVDFSQSAYRDYYPGEGKESEREENCLTTLADTEAMHQWALERIRDAAETGALLKHPQLPYLLFRWSDQNAPRVQEWTSGQLQTDAGVVRFAEAFTSHSWAQGIDDRVARRQTRASVESIDRILDRELFRRRLEALAANTGLNTKDSETVKTFLEAWDRGGRGR
jgi:predicted KAP-like P-loop ATPase